MFTELLKPLISFLMSKSSSEDDVRARMSVLDTMNKLLHNNVIGSEFVILKIINSIVSIQSSFNNFDTQVSIEVVEGNVSGRLRDYVFMKEFKLKEALEYNDQTLNPSDPKDTQNIVNYFFTQIMEVIETALEMDISASEAILAVDTLKTELIRNKYQTKLMEASKLYTLKNIDAAIIKDKELQDEINELQSIPTGAEDEDNVADGYLISSYEDSIKVRRKNGYSNSRPLFAITDAGPLSEKVKIMSDDIAVLIAEINVGKTRFVYDELYRAITGGVNVTFVSTEETLQKIQTKLEKAHLFMTYNYTDYPEQAVLNRADLEDKNLQRQYEILEEKMEWVRRDLWGNPKHGNFRQISNFCYEDAREFFRAEKRIYGSDIIFVDHIRALKSNGRYINGKQLSTQKEQLAYLMQCTRVSKVEDGIAFFLTSHPNTETESAFKSSKTVMSANLSAAAREVSESATRIFFLTTKSHLEANDQVYLYEAKTREEGKIRVPQVLSRQGASNIHLWLPQYQEDQVEENIENLTDI